jgi:4-amino-4-deoxy-L-arabinose transferase-like glycosyltransferase
LANTPTRPAAPVPPYAPASSSYTPPAAPAPLAPTGPVGPTAASAPPSVPAPRPLSKPLPKPASKSAPKPPARPSGVFVALAEGRAVFPVCAAVVIAALGFLPIAQWIPGGYQTPFFGGLTIEWLSGTTIVVGAAVVLAILSRHTRELWIEDAVLRVAKQMTRPRWAFVGGAALVAFSAYALTSVLLFKGRPIFLDEMSQLLQARAYARGSLTTVTGPLAEFVSILHTVYADGRAYSQFPAGGPAMLAIGTLLGVPWLVNPLCGAVAVGAFAWFVLATEQQRTVAVGAVVLFALAPFMLFMSASHMNHVPTLMWLTVAMAALVATLREGIRPGAALLCGFSLGAAAAIRPVDGLAFAVPAALWLFWRAARETVRGDQARRRAAWIELLCAGVGVALPMLALMWVNSRTTGDPLRFGYEVIWGQRHALGFHEAPWGPPHTPARGFEQLNLYFLRLQSYLFDAPVPALLAAVAALALARRVSSMDRYLAASGVLLVGFYWAYWHYGFLLGPRFLFPLIPALALWTARLPALVRERWRGSLWHRGVTYGYLVAVVVAFTYTIPIRWREYETGFVVERLPVRALERAYGVSNALVLVREPWSSQLVARLWALGVPHRETELLTHEVDACRLEEALMVLEREGKRGAQATAALMPLLRDRGQVRLATLPNGAFWPVQSTVGYSPQCRERVRESSEGLVPLAPLLLSGGPSNVYVRDLHARDTLLLKRYPNRPIFVVRRDSSATGVTLRYHRASRDSLQQSWAWAAQW